VENVLVETTDGEPEEQPPARPVRSRRRRILRRVLVVVGVLLLIAGGVGAWALNRYVIDHVEISDVAAYEAAVLATAPVIDITTTTVATAPASAPAGSAAPTTDASTTTTGPPAPVITDHSYVSSTMSIDISQVVTGAGDEQVTAYIADVTVADPRIVRGGFAENEFGTNIVENTSDIAEYYGAVFAINGDYYGFRQSGIVIRNGVLFRDNGVRPGLAMYVDGSMRVYDETTITGEQLVADGVWNTLSFGPALLDGGQVVDGIEDVEVDTNIGNHSIQGNQPRTGVGITADGHYLFIAVDGRSRGYSRGVTMTEFATMFQDLGATVAYNLDGGGSTTMWFNGELVNNPLGKGKQRGTSDIIYLAEPSPA
jgi:exopolysaccharide biosynthesis protein